MRAMRSAAALLLCATASHLAVCQTRPTLLGVPPKAELRLQLLGSTMVVGRLVVLEPGRIRLNTIVRSGLTDSRLVARSVVLDSITAMWVRSGTRWKLGAGIGAAAGSAGLLLVVGIAAESQDGSRCSTWCWTSAAAGGALGGAFLGALVGHQFVVWRPVSF